MRKLLVCIFLIWLSDAFAQSPAKCLEDVNAGNYDVAWLALTRKLGHNPADIVLLYSKSLLFYQHDYQNFNLDSAQYYLQKIPGDVFTTLKKSERKKLYRLGIRPFRLNEYQMKIYSEAFDSTEKKKSIAQWNHYLKVFPMSPYKNVAIQNRNTLAWNDAKNNFSYNSFKDFIDHYPDATQIEEAKMLYEELLYKSKTRDSTYQCYKQFMIDYPNSPFLDSAKENYERLLYITLTAEHTEKAFAAFINDYPNSPYLGQAEDSLYAFTAGENKLTSFKKFIASYPDNKHVTDAWNQLYNLSTLRFDSASIQKFIYLFPDHPLQTRIGNDLELFHINASVIKNDDAYGLMIDSTEKMFPEYSYIDSFSNGLAEFERIDSTSQKTVAGYLNKRGEEVMSPQFSFASLFQNITAYVATGWCDDDACGYIFINRFGKKINANIYDNVYGFQEGYFLVQRDNRYGYVDDSAREIIPCSFSDANLFYDSIAAVGNGNLFGFINYDGKVFINYQYKAALHFSEGLAAVQDTSTGLWGFINTNGEMVIKPLYVSAGFFNNGKAKVFLKPKTDGALPKEIFINKLGKAVK